MNKITVMLLATTLMMITAQAQKDKTEQNYSDPIQVDSSDFFMIPKLIDNDNKDDFGHGKGFLPWGNYSEIYFYNAQSGEAKKLFDQQRTLILPFVTRRSIYDRTPELTGSILSKHIVFLARTDNFNGDNGLDTDDPIYLFVSSKTGDQLRQITPSGMTVLSYTVSADKKIILVKLKSDKNGNKKFGNGDDDLYYRIDLTDDIPKINCTAIAL